MRHAWVNFRPLVMVASDTLHAAMQRMNEHEVSIVLVCDAEGCLEGVVVDGDIRRALLRDPDLQQPLERLMTREPRTVPTGIDESALRSLAESELSSWMPMVDGERRLCGLIDLIRLRREQPNLPNAAVLMAGGKGTRLYPLTRDIPKPMVPVGGKPMLETIIDRLSGQGFERVYISVNHFADQIIDYFGDGHRHDVAITYLHEDKPLGTAGALRQLVDSETEPMVVMNGDVLTRLNARSLLEFHQGEGVMATMAVREYAYQVPFGVVDMVDHRLQGLREKPFQRMFINAGIYCLSPQALAQIPAGERYDMTQLLDDLKDHHAGVACFPVSEYWMDVGRVDDLERARNEFDTHF